jgi:hypothetical protein
MCDGDDAGDETTHVQRAQWLVCGDGAMLLRRAAIHFDYAAERAVDRLRFTMPKHHADHPASQHLQ